MSLSEGGRGDRHRGGKSNVTTEAEIEVIKPAVTSSQKREGMEYPSEPLEEAQTCQHLDFSSVTLILDFWPSQL